MPQFKRVRWLHVVMPVNDEGRCPWRAPPGTIQSRMTATIEQLDVVEAHFFEPLKKMRAGCGHAVGVGWISADTRQAKHRFQPLKDRLVLSFEITNDVVGHYTRSCSAHPGRSL